VNFLDMFQRLKDRQISYMFHLFYETLRVRANPLFRELHELQMLYLQSHYNKDMQLVHRKIPMVFVTIGMLFHLLYTNTISQVLLCVLLMSMVMLILFVYLSNNIQVIL